MSTAARFPLVLVCFVLSGIAGLIYQTSWTQQFALVFGTSELAIATVLAAYMGGLTLGAGIAARLVDRVRRPVLVYGVLELGIAITALAVPLALRAISSLQAAWLTSPEMAAADASWTTTAFYLTSAFVTLLPPTVLMGATLPLLVRHAVRSEREIGEKVGALYTANTLGAAAGTLLAAFVLLPNLGLASTIWIGAALNAAVFFVSLGLVAGDARPNDLDLAESNTPLASASTGSTKETEETERPTARGIPCILPLMLLSGFVSFGWEVLWTRLLSHLLGGSIYAFGTMLATFLIGLSVGAVLAARTAPDQPRAVRGFILAQLGIAACFGAGLWFVDRLPALLREPEFGTWLPVGALSAAAVMLPGAVCIGATFPYAVRILARRAGEAARASGRLLAWNTLGAIIGSIGTGFVLLPWLRIEGVATLVVGCSLLLALAAAVLLAPRSRGLAIVATAGLLVLLVNPIEAPWNVLKTSPISGQQAPGEVTYYAAGRSANVLLYESSGGWRLTTNGLPESVIRRRGAPISQHTLARWLSLLPVAVRPEAESMLIVGFGAGLTVAAAPPTIEELHVVELEPEVIEANRLVADQRIVDPLADPRLTLHLNDARSALTLTQKRFDVIVSQPSHPWTAGASHLFTREFFELVRSRLSDDGVFSQWIGLRFIDDALLRSLVATLRSVFGHVEVYEPFPGGGLLLLAGTEPVHGTSITTEGLATADSFWARLGVHSPDDLLAAWVLSDAGSKVVADGAPITTDARNLLKIRSPKVMGGPHGAKAARQAFEPLDPLIDPELANLYLIRRLIRQGQHDRATRVAMALANPVDRDTGLALVSLTGKTRDRAREDLERLALVNDFEYPEPWYSLVMLNQAALIEHRQAAWLGEWVDFDPASKLVVDGWRATRLGEVGRLAALDPQLAALDPRHPLAVPATRLRVNWRLASRDPQKAREALKLFEPLLAFGHRAGRDLLQRARLASAANEVDTLLESLRMVVDLLDTGAESNRNFSQQASAVGLAQQILRGASTEARARPEYEVLEQRLQSLNGGGGGSPPAQIN